MACFEFHKEGDERANIKTPFPVTQNVWGFFMREMLNPLFVDKQGKDGVNGRVYLNRWENEPVDELAQGQ